MAVSQRDLDLMAWTLLGEAAGEGIKGMQAVANVIVNRANSGQYPSSIGKVVLQPKQFSTWNTGEGGNDPVGQYSKNSEAFQTARAIAEQAVSGKLPDITGGALNYWSPKGMKNGADPYWAKNVPADQRLQIGNHVFLPTHPVPPAPLLAEAPIPATMSRELAYARGLADPSSALAAIENAKGENATAGINAYSPESGKLTTVSRPVYSVGPGGVPFTPQVAGDLRRQIGTQPYSPLEDRMFAALANAPKPTTAPVKGQAILDEIAASGPYNLGGPPTSYASDEALKRLAAVQADAQRTRPYDLRDVYAQSQQPGSPIRAPQMLLGLPVEQSGDPMQNLADLPRRLAGLPLERSVQNSTLDKIAQASQLASMPDYASDVALKRLAQLRAAPTITRDVTTVVQRPDGSSYAVPRAGSNEQPIGRPANVGVDAFRTPGISGPPVDMTSTLYTPKVFGSDAYSPYLVPGIAEGTFQVNETPDWMRNLTSELPYGTIPRLNEAGYDEAAKRTTGAPDLRALDMAMSPRQIAPDTSALRPVANLIAPTIPPDTGIGFGTTPVGALPGAPAAVPAAQANPFMPQTFVSPTPASPAVNRKGYYVGNPMGNYEVGRGETLAKIAKQFNTSVDTLAGVNNIPNPNKISSGAKLFVPTLSPIPVAAKSGTTATPTGGTVTSAQRTAIASSGSGASSGGYSGPSTTSGYTSTPTSYTPSTRSTTSSTGVSIPVYSSASITPTRVATATTPTGGTITQAQMNAIRGLATGGMVPGYEYGGYIPGGTNTTGTQTTYAQDAQRMANALNTVKTASAFIPVVNTATAIGNIVAPQATRDLQASVANQIALAGSPTSGYPRALSRDPSSYEGSPSSSYSGGGDYSSGASTRSSKTTSAPTGGIDGVSGSYTPPTQAQIDALYAPYFRAAVFPPAGYQPGISGEFNYFPQVAAPTTSAPAPQSSWLAKASDWFKSYSDSLGSRSSYDAAKQIKAPDGTSLYTLYKRFRDSLNHDTSPTLGTWQSWLATKGYATGGQISEPRLVLGKGGPTEDKIPARIDGVQEARLSNGEFVMTAAAVRGLGNGDYKRGAEALMRLNDQFAPRREKGTLKVEKVR